MINFIKKLIHKNKEDHNLPVYSPDTHYLEVAKNGYFRELTILRHNIKIASDYFWAVKQKAYNIDLFMLTSSVSSPMGSGSDSEPIAIQFGKLNTYLVDSSQFGFEPILMNKFEKVYCYLPSMRGENPDKRHLNQFFHCEAEIKGTLENLLPKIEDYVRHLAVTLLKQKNILKKISANYDVTIQKLVNLSKCKKFPEIEFDRAVDLLLEHGFSEYVNKTRNGSDISSQGELELMKILQLSTPVWIKNYDRDRVAFYQKPHQNNSSKVINADLLFPAILETSFGGEIVGSGQRQDNIEEMYESLRRQSVNPQPYEWYINLRKEPHYETTSGFGLGIERFIAWSLNRDDIKDVILYPRLKNILSYP